MAAILLAHTPHMRAHYYGDTALQGLRRLGDVLLHDGDEALDAEGVVRAAQGACVIVADRMTAGPAAIFAALPALSAFVRVAVDIRNVDVAAASEAGGLVTQAGPGFVASVCELVIGMMVDLSRGVSRSVRAYQAGEMPAVTMGRQLAGATLGIIGYGSIGRALAPIGAALGMQVLVADPFASAVAAPARQVAMDDVLGRADYVVCLAAATAATENLMDAAAFARMKPGAFFINASRGNLVDEAALHDALTAGRLAGAGMDVGRAPDQMPSPGLAALPNVVATPHIGGLTPEAIAYQAMETVEQVRVILGGGDPRGAVNLPHWSRRP